MKTEADKFIKQIIKGAQEWQKEKSILDEVDRMFWNKKKKNWRKKRFYE